MLNRDVPARRQAPPRATLRHSLGLRGGNCAGRRLDSTTKEKGDCPSTGGEEKDIELSLNEFFFFSDHHRKLRGAFCFFWDGGKGEQVGIECQREQVRRGGPSELRR